MMDMDKKEILPVYPFLTPHDEGYLDGYERKYNCPYEKHTSEWIEYNGGYDEGEKIAIAEYNISKYRAKVN